MDQVVGFDIEWNMGHPRGKVALLQLAVKGMFH
jgi:hypothetical protein